MVSRTQAAMARVSALASSSAPFEDRLGELQEPVAIDVPDEAVERASRVVERAIFKAFRDVRPGLERLAADPAVDGRHGAAPGSKSGTKDAAVHLAEARRVPQLGGEISITFNALCRELDVARLALTWPSG